jgi:polyisoprenoid-binding protein YceI
MAPHLLRLALCATFLFVTACADTTEIDNKPAASVSAPATEAPAAAAPDSAAPADAAGATWTVDPATSTIGFLGAKITATHAGGFTDFTGDVKVKDGKVFATSFTAQAASLWAEEKGAAEGSMAYKLTKHLKSPDFFNVAEHPTATFTSTFIEYGEGNSATVKGNLSFAGKTNAVTFPATIEVADGTAHAKADFTINRKDWGLQYAGKPDDLIKDEVALNLDLNFAR